MALFALKLMQLLQRFRTVFAQPHLLLLMAGLIDLALQLCAHFTSEGRSEQAMFYQRLATVVDTEE